ncbi:hypothetical protein [Vagococcus fluvialis]|uniref:hypothetical protein n=1 Tax=Vagococcus fluvialis TaxID=2738 RepID=UPI00203367EA|nr:hypothetical protein [Vagococcus fluvialis]MCM2138994.1 hypothetical protein [Vagococcus fluvialis]
MLFCLDDQEVTLITLDDIVKEMRSYQTKNKLNERAFNMLDAYKLAIENYGEPYFISDKSILMWYVQNNSEEE